MMLLEFTILSTKLESLTLRPHFLENDLQSQTISIIYFLGIGKSFFSVFIYDPVFPVMFIMVLMMQPCISPR